MKEKLFCDGTATLEWPFMDPCPAGCLHLLFVILLALEDSFIFDTLS